MLRGSIPRADGPESRQPPRRGTSRPAKTAPCRSTTTSKARPRSGPTTLPAASRSRPPPLGAAPRPVAAPPQPRPGSYCPRRSPAWPGPAELCALTRRTQARQAMTRTPRTPDRRRRSPRQQRHPSRADNAQAHADVVRRRIPQAKYPGKATSHPHTCTGPHYRRHVRAMRRCGDARRSRPRMLSDVGVGALAKHAPRCLLPNVNAG